MQEQFDNLRDWKGTSSTKLDQDVTVWRGTIAAGDLLYVPPGFIFTELCGPSTFGLGLKLPLLTDASAECMRRLKQDLDVWGAASPAVLTDAVQAMRSCYVFCSCLDVV